MPLRHKIESESGTDIPKWWSRVEEVSIYHPGQINAYGCSFCLKGAPPTHLPLAPCQWQFLQDISSQTCLHGSSKPHGSRFLFLWYLVSWLIMTSLTKLCIVTQSLHEKHEATEGRNWVFSVCPQDLAVSFSQQKCVLGSMEWFPGKSTSAKRS